MTISPAPQHDSVREVKQFHYTGWPDFGVPDYPHPVLAFIKRLGRFKRTTEGPDIMHCSAGVGRTGTLVAIQAMMEMIREEGSMDVFNFVLGMRQQRNYMVQTEVRAGLVVSGVKGLLVQAVHGLERVNGQAEVRKGVRVW